MVDNTPGSTTQLPANPLDVLMAPGGPVPKIINAPDYATAAGVSTDVMTALGANYTKAKVQDMQTSTDQLNQSVTGFKALSQQAQDAIKNKQAVNSQIQDAMALPAVARNFMGIFDRDYNVKVLSAREQAANDALAGVQTSMDSLQNQTKMNQDIIQNHMGMITAQYQGATNTLQSALDFAKAKADQTQQNFTNRLSLKQDARADSELAMTKQSHDIEMQKHQIEIMSDNEINAAAANPNGGSGMTQHQAQMQQIEREKLAIDMKQANLSLKNNQMADYDYTKADILKNMSTPSLKMMADAANSSDTKDFTMTHGGQTLNFTAEDINSKLAEINTNVRAQNKIAGDNAAAASDISFDSNMGQQWINNFTNMTGGKVDNTVMTQTYMKGVAQAKAHIMAGDVMSGAATMKATTDSLQKFADDYIGAQSKDQQPFLRAIQYGTGPNSTDALKYLGVEAMSGTQTQFDGRYATPANMFGASFRAKFKGSGGTATRTSGGKVELSASDVTSFMEEANKKAPDMEALLSMSWGDTTKKDAQGNIISSPIQAWGGERDTLALKLAVQNLTVKIPSVFTGFDLNTFIKDGVLQTNDMAYALHSKWEADQQAAAIAGMNASNTSTVKGGAPQQNFNVPVPSSVPYEQLLFSYMGSADFQKQIHDYYSGGLDAASQATALLTNGGNPLMGYAQSLQATQDAFQKFLPAQKAADLKAAQDALVQMQVRQDQMGNRF